MDSNVDIVEIYAFGTTLLYVNVHLLSIPVLILRRLKSDNYWYDELTPAHTHPWGARPVRPEIIIFGLL